MGSSASSPGASPEASCHALPVSVPPLPFFLEDGSAETSESFSVLTIDQPPAAVDEAAGATDDAAGATDDAAGATVCAGGIGAGAGVQAGSLGVGIGVGSGAGRNGSTGAGVNGSGCVEGKSKLLGAP